MVRVIDDSLEGTEVFINEAGSISIREWCYGADNVIAVKPDDVPDLIKELRQARRAVKRIKAEEPSRN